MGEGLKPTSNSALKGAQGSKRRSAINATAEVQINVNGENMLVTVESLDRTIPKHLQNKKSALSKNAKKNEIIA